MPLTPAEQRELEALERDADQRAIAGYGRAVDTHVSTVVKPEADFVDHALSPMRALILGPVRDTLNEVLDLGRDAIQLGQSIGRDLGGTAEVMDLGGDEDIVPDIRGSDTAGPVENIVRDVAGYLVPYAGWAKALRVMKGATWAARAGRGTMAGALTDFTAQDPLSANLANTLRDTFGVESEMLDALANDADDNDLAGRLKAAAVNAPVGLLAEGVFELGAGLIRAYRGVKGEAEEARGIIEALRQDYGVKRVKPEPQQTLREATENAIDEADVTKEAFDPSKHIDAANQPESWADVLTYLQRRVGDDLDVTQSILDDMAKIVHGDPDNALARIGIDPAKLDWGEYANPDGAANLHKALTDIQEKIAERIGRTGQRVGMEQVFGAARAWASDADVLRSLYGATKNLPEVLTAARMFVGGHTHKLLNDAETALDALMKGEGGPEAWDKFLESFHRHAYFLGTVRGAGSEIGRALNSLKYLARRNKDVKDVAKGLRNELDKAEEAAPEAAERADEQLSEVLTIESDAERIVLLSTLLDKEGDIGALAQFVRQKNGSTLQRLSGAAKETLGSLFSQATAAFNITSGIGFLGLRAMGKWLSTGARWGLAPFSKEMERSARVAAAEAWAYTDGLVASWGEAWDKTLAVIDREAASEMFVNLDQLGFRKLAERAAKRMAKAHQRLGRENFERVDLEARPRSLAINPVERRAINEWIENHSFGRLMEVGMKAFARTAGAAINATGTSFRLGTTLFINAPDQFVGSAAARAGAQSFAVRQAAKEAAELGLEGKELDAFLKARWTSLTSDIEGWSNKGFEQGFRESAFAAGEHEAREILFQDPADFKFTRGMSRLHTNTPFASLFIEFLHTPLRILERSVIDYTPLGLAKDRIRKALLAGGPERDQALAQMALGTYMMALGWKLVEDRDIVASDGGFTSTSRLQRERFSLRAGADHIEFVRADPMGTLLGMMADFRAYMDNNNDSPEDQREKGKTFKESIFWAVTSNILSKTWLLSLRDLVEAAGAGALGDEGRFAAAVEKLQRNKVRRFVPAAGVQKGIQGIFDPWERHATDWQDELLKNTFAAGKLPIKRDFLGEPETKNLGERFTGLTWQPRSEEPLIKEFEELNFKAPMPEGTIEGVRLSADQKSRLLELKGQVIRSDKFLGMTMREALDHVIQQPGYQAMRREARIETLRDVMKDYTRAAKKQLIAEDQELARRVLAESTFQQGRKDNLTDDAIEAQTRRFAEELGLTED